MNKPPPRRALSFLSGTALRERVKFATGTELRSNSNARPNRACALGATLAAAFAAGCGVQSTVQEMRQGPTNLGDDAIVILSRKHKTQSETEDDFVSCLSGSVNSGQGAVRVLTEAEFMDATFPWFEPRTAPLTMEDLAEVISRPIIASRIREIGVRYLVWLEGTTQRSDESGALQCTVVTGGIPACFGFLSWENGANYEASVWDVREGTTVGTLSSEATGTSFVPAVVVPLPFIARVRQRACANLSEQLKAFLAPA